MRIPKIPQAEKYTAQNRLMRRWRRAILMMACIVVFGTTYALSQPAITLENPDPWENAPSGAEENGIRIEIAAAETRSEPVILSPAGHDPYKQIRMLPETGGPGTTMYTMAGCMLMLFCAAYLLYKERKRRREAA